MGKRALSFKERLFVYYYTAGADGVRGNATRAWIEAGGTKKHAGDYASRLLKKPEIQAAIEETFRAIEIETRDVLAEMRSVAFVDPLDFYNHEGRLRPLNEVPRHARVAIRSIEFHEDGTIAKLTLQPKVEGLRLLALCLGMTRKAIGLKGKLPLDFVQGTLEEAVQDYDEETFGRPELVA